MMTADKTRQAQQAPKVESKIRKYEGERMPASEWYEKCQDICNERDGRNWELCQVYRLGGNEVKVLWKRRYKERGGMTE